MTSFICQNIFPKLSQKRNLSLNSIRRGHQRWPAYEWLAVAYSTKLFVYNFWRNHWSNIASSDENRCIRQELHRNVLESSIFLGRITVNNKPL